MKFILVTTQHRGVFAGLATEEAVNASSETRRIKLAGAKMAIRFGCTRGVMELAHTGPTVNSRIGAPADVELHNVTAIFACTEAATAAWSQR